MAVDQRSADRSERATERRDRCRGIAVARPHAAAGQGQGRSPSCAVAYPSQYTLRPNWLHPPFDNPKLRLALAYGLDQKEFLQSAVGDPAFWRLCKTYYGCGTPLASDAGTAGLLDGNVARARELVKEGGYDGTPVVLLHITDIAVLSNLAPVAKAQLERMGFKVDMVSSDWQTHIARVMRREPPAQRGWNVTLSSTGIIDVVNPVTSLFLNSACDKASAGWPCDQEMEELRDAFARELDPAKRKTLSDEIQARACRSAPTIRWASGTRPGRQRAYHRLASAPSASVFWGVERTGR